MEVAWPSPLSTLCVDQGRDLAEQFERALAPHPVRLEFERSIGEVIDRLEQDDFDLLLVSSRVLAKDRQEAFDLLDLIQAKVPGTQVFLLVLPEQRREVLQAMRSRAFHHAILPLDDHELRAQVQAAVMRRPRARPAPKRGRGGGAVPHMIGRSPAMRAVNRQIRQAAATDIPVLLTGETGCGKELAAHAIYEQSSRAGRAYLPVHIGSLPATLVGDELLGHERGAFTSASGRKEGCFERADGGTVFLDEISTMDHKMQVSLLRILEQQQFTRLGGHEPVSVDVRIIAASNVDLADLVRAGRFREDLYYRLDVMHIELPPLRERHGDISVLVEHFLRQCNRSFRKRIKGLSPDFLACLENYDWPGNVRELKNVMQRATVLCEEDVLTPRHLPQRLRGESAPRRTFPVQLGSTLADVERELIRNTLQYAGFNRTRAARILGISRRALYNKLIRHGL